MTVILSAVGSGIGILKRMMKDKRAILPVIAAGARGAAAAGKAAGQAAASAGKVASNAVAQVSKGAVAAEKVAGQAVSQASKGAVAAEKAAGQAVSQASKGAAAAESSAAQMASQTAQIAANEEETSNDLSNAFQQEEFDEEKFRQNMKEKVENFERREDSLEQQMEEEIRDERVRSQQQQKPAQETPKQNPPQEPPRQSPPTTTRPQYGAIPTAAINATQQGSTSAGSTIGVILSVILGLFVYKSSSSGGAVSLLLAVLPILIIILGLAFGAPGGMLTVLVLCVIFAELIYIGAGQASLTQILPALLGPGLIGAGILTSIIVPREQRSKVAAIAIIGLFAGGTYFSIFDSSAYAMTAITAGVSGEGLQKTGTEAAAASKTSISAMVQDFKKTYDKQMAMATGQYIEGDVDQSVKEEVGVEIADPYLMNPSKINEGELLEISARIKGNDPKSEMHIATACHMQTSDAASKIMTTAGPNMNPGDVQKRQPTNFTGNNFDQEVTCYPTISSCGKYVVTLSAQADKLRTDAYLYNYMMDQTTLKAELKEREKSKGEELKSFSQIESAKAELHPEIGSYKSVSQKGAIKTVMMTEKSALIGIDSTTKIKLASGIENAKDGWVMGVNKVEITVPEFLDVDSEYCKGWTRSENKLTLSTESLNKISFKETPKGQQKLFPSCLMTPKSGSETLTEPQKATFLMLVDYNYIVQKTYNVEVKNSTGGTCTAKTTTTSGNTSNSTYGSTSTSSGKTMTSAEKDALINSIASQRGYEPAVLKAILAVESRGNAFGSDGKPIIRFEPHIFDAECGCADGVPPTFTPGAKRSVAGVSCDGGQSAEYACFEKAKTINENAAYKSISVGIAQILGRYPSLPGYSSAKEMYDAFAASEKAQIEGFFTFLENKKMSTAIKQKDWTQIALLYNGKGQEQLYASKLQTNYGTYSSQSTTMVA